MASTLPVDIIVGEILPRLPAKSLLRFKCVCKFFRTLISSPEFVDRHLRHSMSSDANRLLFFAGYHGRFYSFDLDCPGSSAGELGIPVHFNWGEVEVFIVGSCKGLLCLGNVASEFIVLNPSTGIFREIPSLDSEGPGTLTSGFGFDDVNEDYKIVSVMQVSGIDNNVIREWVMVYSLKSNEWRQIEDRVVEDMISSEDDGALIQNHLVHWSFWSPVHDRIRIGCFDLQNEQWGNDVPLPISNAEAGGVESDMLFGSHRNKRNDVVHLGVLDGCLCLSMVNSRECTIDVLVMKEYGVKESWVKLLGIHPDLPRCPKVVPLAYAKGSRQEILLTKGRDSELLWYKPRYEMLKRVRTYGVVDHSQAHVCEGSLVTIPGGDQLNQD